MAETTLAAADAGSLLRQFALAPVPSHCPAFAQEVALQMLVQQGRR